MHCTALLDAGATPEGRKELQQTSGIGHEYILDWVNRADLMRVRGVGEEYSDLLENAGVDTVVGRPSGIRTTSTRKRWK